MAAVVFPDAGNPDIRTTEGMAAHVVHVADT